MNSMCIIKKITLAFILVSGTLFQAYSQTQTTKPFTFFAFGDMPYGSPTDEAHFKKLMDTLNTQNQAFNIHVGDIKSGKMICSDEYYTLVFGYFNQFKKPLIYLPGDNDWTDCGRKACGSFDPVERLSMVRKTFFSESKSCGKEKISYTSQSANLMFSKFVENNRWDYNKVTFSTIHVVGSNNNYIPDSTKHNKEFYSRDSANVNWLQETFVHAIQNKSLGVVLIIHADMFGGTDEKTGFAKFIAELKKQTIVFHNPVLLINGDSHQFIIDKPLVCETPKNKSLYNFTRLQVFGETDVNAVKIFVNPANPNLFEIQQFIVNK